MVKLNKVSPIDYNNTSVRDPQSSGINIDQTSIIQSRTLWEQIRTKKWIRIVLLILGSGDAEKTLSTEATTTITATLMITATRETTTTTTIITTTTTIIITAITTTTTTTSANVNEDDKLDVIIGNYFEKTIMIFLNRDDGTFTQSKTVSYKFKPSHITTGDINNDDNLDIIVISSDASDITVFYNAGNGNFNNSMIISTEVSLADVKAVDINKDNKLDLIVACSFEDCIIVILNDGNGVFRTPVRYETPFSPLTLEVIDVNNDALPDIITTHDKFKMNVLLNSDNGNFIEQKPTSLNRKPDFIKFIDINGDNKIDLIVGYYLSFQIRFGFGNSTFADPVEYPIEYELKSLETADFNNDNKMDIILSHPHNNKTSILFNTGNGTFREQKVIDNIDQPKYASMIDIDSDGKVKLVIANDQTIRILHLRC
ncbi:unnamed protein product [Adineta steineri]|uniref:Uncharacterized protein n=1 Tax=Adineta steineri TaxID=433720 RepID=A0A819GM40_9BILA|nr:unnamed protein product [Adineta steineri]CAF3881980.1 unnamed protein product [Adineta steineri]